MNIQRLGDFRDIPGLPIISKVVVHNGLAYTSGVTGRPGSNITEQTNQALEQLDQLLENAGTSRRSILTAQVWLADMADFSAHNEAWDAWVDPAHPPARACVGGSLYDPEVLVEIRAVAVVEDPGGGG